MGLTPGHWVHSCRAKHEGQFSHYGRRASKNKEVGTTMLQCRSLGRSRGKGCSASRHFFIFFIVFGRGKALVVIDVPLTKDAAVCRVAGGLDSLVQGEGQILAQCKQVYKVGQNCPNFGRHMNGLFKQALTAGKRVRAETSISSGAVSVSSAAAELAQMKLPSNSFDGAKVRSP
jgi:hypothetical protein